ncbi:MAG: hypothetical protein JXR07_04965 [Reichenbachiella sp.]
MKNTSKKFLKFNDKTISFLAIDGEYWIAIKPICEVLNVNFDRQYKNLKSDKILDQLYAKQPMTGADKKTYNMVALPEKFIYGWLFSIRSDSKELQTYKMECYEVLFNHFHGSVTGRSEVLKEKMQLQEKVAVLKSSLIDNEDYQALVKAEAAILRTGKNLKSLDKQFINEQLVLWQQ